MQTASNSVLPIPTGTSSVENKKVSSPSSRGGELFARDFQKAKEVIDSSEATKKPDSTSKNDSEQKVASSSNPSSEGTKQHPKSSSMENTSEKTNVSSSKGEAAHNSSGHAESSTTLKSTASSELKSQTSDIEGGNKLQLLGENMPHEPSDTTANSTALLASTSAVSSASAPLSKSTPTTGAVNVEGGEIKDGTSAETGKTGNLLPETSAQASSLEGKAVSGQALSQGKLSALSQDPKEGKLTDSSHEVAKAGPHSHLMKSQSDDASLTGLTGSNRLAEARVQEGNQPLSDEQVVMSQSGVAQNAQKKTLHNDDVSESPLQHVSLHAKADGNAKPSSDSMQGITGKPVLSQQNMQGSSSDSSPTDLDPIQPTDGELGPGVVAAAAKANHLVEGVGQRDKPGIESLHQALASKKKTVETSKLDDHKLIEQQAHNSPNDSTDDQSQDGELSWVMSQMTQPAAVLATAGAGVAVKQAASTGMEGVKMTDAAQGKNALGNIATSGAMLAGGYESAKDSGISGLDKPFSAANDADVDALTPDIDMTPDDFVPDEPLELRKKEQDSLISKLSNQVDSRVSNDADVGGLSGNSAGTNHLNRTGLAGAAGVQLAHQAPNNQQNLTMSLPPNHPGWANEMAQKVSWVAASDGRHTAHIKLDPPELGSLTVKVSVDHDSNTTQVSFVAATPQARDALEGQMHRLRDMLSQQGMNLDQVNVDVSGQDASGARYSQSNGETGSRSMTNLAASMEDVDDIGDSIVPGNVSYVSPSGVYYYA